MHLADVCVFCSLASISSTELECVGINFQVGFDERNGRVLYSRISSLAQRVVNSFAKSLRVTERSAWKREEVIITYFVRGFWVERDDLETASNFSYPVSRVLHFRCRHKSKCSRAVYDREEYRSEKFVERHHVGCRIAMGVNLRVQEPELTS